MGTVGLSALMPVGRNGKLVYTDPKKGKRAIRHCLNEESPFIDEQSEFAVVEPIIFVRGFYEVEPSNKSTLKFLNIHPGNKKNGGKLFYEVDEEQEAISGLFLEDLVVELKFQAKQVEKEGDIGFHKLMALASVIKGSYSQVKDKSTAELRAIVYNSIQESPMSYWNAEKKEAELFKADVIQSYMAIQAIDKGVVTVSPDQRRITWPKGDVITEIPAGRKVKEYFAEYLGSEDGILIAKDLEKKL